MDFHQTRNPSLPVSRLGTKLGLKMYQATRRGRHSSWNSLAYLSYSDVCGNDPYGMVWYDPSGILRLLVLQLRRFLRSRSEYP
jgi:hypothetical protein